ncbi:hypothetical protein G5B32_03900 [Sphingobacterium sp. SGL-16]|uniref:Uncharacterized protein n=2 Tax=Sphingobacteriaceae TaxID=84566 RepID=A0ABR7YCQ0_9SPHI|nr:hypothetical protein [Sphingobacterium litopenaei]NGM72398.1 hypothetical protein [Sphingobacterium sp. SGL-16]
MMLRLRYIILTICFIFTLHLSSQAQQNFEAIESEKIAYITKELKLSPSEAERFFPIYNQYNKEMWDLKRAKRGFNVRGNSLNAEKRDVIAFDAKEVELKKSYRAEFAKIVGQTRASQFFQVEEDFFNLLRSKIQNSRKK